MLLFAVVALTTTVKGAVSAFYATAGKVGSFLLPSTMPTVLLENGKNGVGFDPPILYNDPSIISEKLSLFGIQDWNGVNGGGMHLIGLNNSINVGRTMGHYFEGSPEARSYPYIYFDWSLQGRFLDSSTTFLDILEVERDGENLTAVAFDFRIFENTMDRLDLDANVDPSAFGSFRYNSSIPLHGDFVIPETTPVLLFGLTGLFFVWRRHRHVEQV